MSDMHASESARHSDSWESDRKRVETLALLIDRGERPLEGQDAVITGAGRGIGRAAALTLGKLGALVTLVSRTPSDLQETAELIHRIGAEASLRPCDVSAPEQVRALFEDTDVDILINAAGVNVPQPFLAVTEDIYERVMTVNVKATFVTSQHAVRRMLAQRHGGVIVNVSSQMAHVGGPDRSVYCASKAAVEGLTRALAVELAHADIRVNSVAPTFIETAMTADSLAKPSFRHWALEQLPIGRFGTVDEVAAAIGFLASPAASLITGISLIVDGGWTAH